MKRHCQICNYTFQKSHSCPMCRTNSRLASKGFDISKSCQKCTVKTRIFSNGECRRCLADQRLKECQICHTIQAKDLSFGPKKGSCVGCLHPHDRKDAVLDIYLQKTYGIDLASYASLELVQDGKCAICHKKSTDRRLAVDHDHKTGQVRGLLCTNCNLGLGNFQDSGELLENAKIYLKSDAPATQLIPEQKDHALVVRERNELRSAYAQLLQQSKRERVQMNQTSLEHYYGIVNSYISDLQARKKIRAGAVEYLQKVLNSIESELKRQADSEDQ